MPTNAAPPRPLAPPPPQDWPPAVHRWVVLLLAGALTLAGTTPPQTREDR